MLVLISFLFASLVSSECVDKAGWGCEDITDPAECNPMHQKFCKVACAQCEDETPPEPENECTETFEPECLLCSPDDDCDGMTYKIITRGEGQSGKFGCTYP